MPHLPFKTDFKGGFPELFAVFRVRRQRGMHQFMDEDAKHLGRLGEIGPDNDFMVAVVGRAGMRALSGDFSLPAVRCERNGESDRIRQGKTELGEIRPQFIRGSPQIGFTIAVIIGRTGL